jgi:hypothetical protein
MIPDTVLCRVVGLQFGLQTLFTGPCPPTPPERTNSTRGNTSAFGPKADEIDAVRRPSREATLELATRERVPKASTTTYRVARASPGWNQWLKRGLCIQLEPVLPPPVNCRPQVYCKSLRPRTGRYLFGAFYKTMEGKYGHHDTSDHHRCAAVARRRLVRPGTLVLDWSPEARLRPVPPIRPLAARSHHVADGT